MGIMTHADESKSIEFEQSDEDFVDLVAFPDPYVSSDTLEYLSKQRMLVS
jgi:hypothetical protein